ncbi:MAG: hypothetical protein HLUCCA12_06810 [Rhodobacteraceae bacterium HLUCCA12]|nr:MAG: hypothetical protein HLUCCA12_06810 [Rhodobacteraceae bacterium HLUCCA12]
MAAVSSCGNLADDATPRLLSPQELRAGVEAGDGRAQPPDAALDHRAAALRGRAAALRTRQTPADEDDALRRRARALTAPRP